MLPTNIDQLRQDLLQLEYRVREIERSLIPGVVIDVGYGSATVTGLYVLERPSIIAPALSLLRDEVTGLERDIVALASAIDIAVSDGKKVRVSVQCRSDVLLEVLLGGSSAIPIGLGREIEAQIERLLRALTEKVLSYSNLIINGLTLIKGGKAVGVFPKGTNHERRVQRLRQHGP